MAITAIEYSFFRSLRRQGLMPIGGDVLEVGEANWYGDVGVSNLLADIPEFAPTETRDELLLRLDLLARTEPPPLFDIAKVFWAVFLRPRSLTAIDLHGGPNALRLNLNEPVNLQGRQFDVVLNLGTLEHVFNIGQAMATLHELTRPGGVIVHGMPLTGWLDHGFYSFHPTFYWDLAAVNGYAVSVSAYAQLDPLKIIPLKDRDSVQRLARQDGLGVNSLLYFVLRKAPDERPFKVPMQGYYAGRLSEEGAASWQQER